ncbi:sporulation protein YqfC [Bacillaceae bacterium SIJ1]|uniref:sporulation protein YqfC n=1 Tax=Litoribacterium kuwaitense TaxID=1398745 RepID=UPI0013EC078A|nr:sporulation protein YqfC [Litoribacterium kuwaitense]NGP43519.1 sporulation protein YqfC [Litoribacterium kuwaitense]
MLSLTKKWRKWATRYLDLPADVTLDLPRITMVGHLHLYIENHKGLLVYSEQELRLRLTQGQLLVEGKEFVIKSMFHDELVLEGIIENVRYIHETL